VPEVATSRRGWSARACAWLPPNLNWSGRPTQLHQISHTLPQSNSPDRSRRLARLPPAIVRSRENPCVRGGSAGSGKGHGCLAVWVWGL
jgi:hypothetical protein